MVTNSLAFRLLAVTSLWTALALVVTGFILSTVFRQNAERGFERLLLAHTYNLMGAAVVSDNGEVSGTPNLGDPRFLAPLSGWYWAIAKADTPLDPLMHSPSISGDQLQVAVEAVTPFNEEFRRSVVLTGNNGNQIQRMEAQLYLGEGNVLYQVMVAGNKSGIEASISRFNRTIVVFFFLFGLGTIVATGFVIRFGLKPLRHAADALQDVREGNADQLHGNFPQEIQPLAGEINALISANISVVERARTQVGNLAHALKTPLAVILNEVRKPGKSTPQLVSEQAELMKSQVQSYLDRARIAAQRGAITSRTPVQPVLQRLVRVMRKLTPGLKFLVVEEATDVDFRGEGQDLEELLGNLLENASRFAKTQVVVSVENHDETGLGKFLRLSVDDDGPGLTTKQRQNAIKRGIRLDETKPGSGLGLSIVQDIASEYGGRFELADNKLGGLRATIILPKVPAR